MDFPTNDVIMRFMFLMSAKSFASHIDENRRILESSFVSVTGVFEDSLPVV